MKNLQSEQQVLLGHPKGLFFLFFAELWERFSFYGMRALLTLYMTEHLLYSDKFSFGVFAAYGSLVYVTPLLGGALADKILGYKKAIILGGVLMAIGHFVLAVEHPIAFYTALALLIIGNGFFKPNISSFVGALYSHGDNRRDAGFMIFYMGVNIGGWIAPLLCGWLGVTYGWHYGFGLAGIGMLIGLFVFNQAVRKGVFLGKGNIVNHELYNREYGFIKVGHWITVGALLIVPLIALFIRFNEYEHYLVGIVSIGILIVLIMIYSRSTKKERGQLLVIIYFTALACLFFTVFEQAGSSLTLFAQRNVNLVFINASQSNSLNSAYIVLRALPVAWLWTYLSKINRNPSSPLKMGLGMLLVGAGFLIFGYSAQFSDSEAQVPMLFLVGGILIYTLGELLLSPVGLSKVTELAPKKYLSFLMGVWFLASFYGHFFAGKIAQLTTVKEGESNIFTEGIFENIVSFITNLEYSGVQEKGGEFLQLHSYVSVFSGIGFVTFLVGGVAIFLAPLIQRLMGGVK